MFVENAVQPAENTAEKLCILWGPGMPGPQLTAISFLRFDPQGRNPSLPGTLPPPQTATAARGLAALHPHIKPVRRAGCPHPAEAYRYISFPHRRPVGAGHARPANLPPYPFYDSIRRGGIHPSRTPSHRRKRLRRPEGWPPYDPTSNPCVGRGALTPPKPAAPYVHHLYISLNLFIFL